MEKETYERERGLLRDAVGLLTEQVLEKLRATPPESVTGQTFKHFSGVLKDLRDLLPAEQDKQAAPRVEVVFAAGPEEWNG